MVPPYCEGMGRRGLGCGCFGCGGSFLLVLAVLAGLSWFFVLRPARDFVAGMQAPAQTQTTPAPTGNINAPLTQADVQKFVRVRRKVAEAMGGSLSGLQQLMNDLNSGQTPNAMQVLGVLRDTASSVGAARNAQATALNAENLSLERYGVVRSAVNRALGLPSVDLGKVAESLQKGQVPDLSTNVQTATPQEKVLVTPFKNELMKTAAVGLLGL